MEKEKKKFKDKWIDKKYQAKVKLSGYGIFIVFVVLIVILGQGSNNNDDNNLGNNIEMTEKKDIIFSKPDVNNFAYEIEIITEKDDLLEKFYYYGRILDAYEELIKKIGEKEYNYRIIDDKYYVLNNNNNYILTTNKDVYDILDYSYLNIDNINNYLSYSKFVDDKYRIYLKDIILDNNTDLYITMILKGDNISINYTNLINYLNNDNYDSYIVNIEFYE